MKLGKYNPPKLLFRTYSPFTCILSTYVKIFCFVAKSGVQAKFLLPQFPTKTFPNHFTTVTVCVTVLVYVIYFSKLLVPNSDFLFRVYFHLRRNFLTFILISALLLTVKKGLRCDVVWLLW